ncbi:hypothetical protein GQ43DRAFT_462125 [Delitschia confertaspora ATCC 74209]|uniref:Uncharacterized protein n=1 Tax=Delitschia confertaspora ATCC 74209 TaxID=1513339 RepID=A0A9P4JT33_9PLEO|nr:hypothetical protein GQ43DRAFT_462125 [Delitschia confertaspora ATCC 74209]
MDPLAAASAVIAISGRCVRTARALYDLRTKYKDASITISAIYSESTVISTSLGHIHMLISKNSESLRTTLRDRPELSVTFDQALTGCVLVYSVLDDEVTKLYSGIGKEGVASVRTRMKFLWKEEGMKDILMQIRGQQTALGLLIQALQMSSLAEISKLLRNNTTVLQAVAQKSSKFRQANPRVKAPSSVFELAIDDFTSLYSYDSSATSTNFAFDDDIINSQAYRRALHSSRSPVNLSIVQEQSETSSGSATVVDKPSITESDKWKIPIGVRLKLSIEEIDSLLAKMEEMALTQPKVGLELEKVLEEYNVLKGKYNRVKQLYFELAETKETNLKQIQILNAEIERLKNENEELLASNLHHDAQNQKHHEDLERAKQHFDRMGLARKNLVESYNKVVKLKDERIEQLESFNKKDKDLIVRFQKSDEEKSTTIGVLAKRLEDLESAHQTCPGRINEFEDHIKELMADHRIKEEELNRYKAFDPILEQLRALSPSSSSPSTSVPRLAPPASPSTPIRRPALPVIPGSSNAIPLRAPSENPIKSVPRMSPQPSSSTSIQCPSLPTSPST